MTVYRLYTERFDNLPAIVGKHFDGATLILGVGLWRGTQEQSTIIEVITDDVDAAMKIARLAGDIARTNHQVSVLISRHQAVVFSYDNTEGNHG